jgi:putative ABC transport system permease protein
MKDKKKRVFFHPSSFILHPSPIQGRTMSFFSAIRVALSALLVNKGRSALTSLGIVIGISAVIAMVSAAGGARKKLDERLESVGKNLILIRAGGRTAHGTIADFVPLSNADAEALRRQLGPLLLGVSESQATQRMTSSRTGNWATMVVGSTPSVQAIREWKVERGRFIAKEDMQKVANVCVIGQTTRRKLFGTTIDPLNEIIRIDRMRLRVIGVLKEKGRMPQGADQDDQIMLPITTFQRKLVGEERVELIITAARSADLIPRAKEEITRVLRQQHHIKPGATDNFDVSSVKEMAEVAVVIARIMEILIAVIASISLVVGGIGIMNIMLVSVTERTREIGIRMAVGATGFDVLVQFLIEAVALALVGGVIGITLGMGGAIALAYFAKWPVIVEPGVVLLAFGVSAAVGIFFGYYPALKASRLDPIEALRYE